MSALHFRVIPTATNCCKREEIVNKLLTVLVTVLALLGFVQLFDLIQERPQFGIPLFIVLSALWLYAALIGYRDKR